MKLTRRGLVSSGLVALAGTAGCLGGGSNVRYPAEARPPVDEEGEPLVGGSSVPEDQGGAESVTGSVPNEVLARDTRRIVAELAWFGDGYDAAIDAFREEVAIAERATRDVLSLDSVGETELDQLRDAVTRARTAAARELGGHFPVAGVVESVGSNHLAVIEKFAGREDHDRLDAEIRRLADFLNGLRGRPYIDRHLSADPVQNHLVDWLRGSRSLNEDDPSLFAVYHGPTRFRALAYAGDQVVADHSPFPRLETAAEGPFAGLATPERRRGVTVVRSYQPPDRDEWPDFLERETDEDEDDEDDDDDEDAITPLKPLELLDPADYRVDAIHIQRYADAAAAGEALDALFGDGVRKQGVESLGGREWRRLYYRQDGDVNYAFTLQAGEFLLSISASEAAWEERTDWREPFRRSWVLDG
jgi:hypothetical protein